MLNGHFSAWVKIASILMYIFIAFILMVIIVSNCFQNSDKSIIVYEKVSGSKSIISTTRIFKDNLDGINIVVSCDSNISNSCR